MTTEAGPTRERLISAAERLFADRGIDAVSLREVIKLAGARNSAAVQYHFGDRQGLLEAILERHLPAVEAGRHSLLDEYEASGRTAARPLAGALVRPLAAKLADGQGGPEFLQVYADLLDRVPPQAGSGDSSMKRWRSLALPVLDPEAVRLHRRFTAISYTATELARRARVGPRADDRLFTSWLIDVIAAVLEAPVSDETRRLVELRPPQAGQPAEPA